MANSRRIYITLNSDKDKDRIIEDLLSNSYSESDFIKETLYRLATQGDNLQLLNENSTQKVQKATKNNKRITKVTKSKSNNRVQKGAENNLKDKKVIENTSEILSDTKSDSEVDNITNSIQEQQFDTNNDNNELMNNLSNNLNNYF